MKGPGSATIKIQPYPQTRKKGNILQNDKLSIAFFFSAIKVKLSQT